MAGGHFVLPRKLEFFRVLFPGFESRLRLPSLFANYFMEGNGTWATLWSPLGKCWRVKARVVDERMCFADGWQKFVADHKLSMGDFLVFAHKGALAFDVAIFDLTACERHFGSISTSEVKENTTPREENNSSRKENSEDALQCSTRQTRASHGRKVSQGMEPHVKERQPVVVEEYIAPSQVQKPSAAMTTRQTRSSHGRKVAQALMEPDVKERQPIVVEEYIARRQDHGPSAAMNGHDRRPHQFEVVMKKHHSRSFLNLPSRFVASNGLSRTQRLWLRDPKGQLWPTMLCHGKAGSRTRPRISEGWKEFCAANNLQKGDSCVFEHEGNSELQVRIRRRPGLPDLENESEGLPRKRKARELGKNQQAYESIDNNCIPGVESICTIFHSSFRLDCLNIPKGFSSWVDLSALSRIILVDSKSRRWPVKVCHWRLQGSDQVRLGRGWRAFCMENNVQVGDVCVLKPGTGEGNPEFHVEVVKKSATLTE